MVPFVSFGQASHSGKDVAVAGKYQAMENRNRDSVLLIFLWREKQTPYISWLATLKKNNAVYLVWTQF